MGKFLGASCLHCKAINPNAGVNQHGRISISYERVDRYPSFPALMASSREGCGFCGLLRHALQDKYSDNNIAKAESDFHSSIRANWPTSGWDDLVTVDGAVFLTEEDWPERDMDQVSGQPLGGIHTLLLNCWPYPPRRSDCKPEFNGSHLVFAVYNEFGK